MENMKKNPLNRLTRAANQFKANIKSATGKKNQGYLYTEDDLGEDLLDAGVTYTYKAIKHHFELNPWRHMLRSQAS
jgi:hypothetical protein